MCFRETDGQNVYKIGDFRILGQGNIGFVPIPVSIMLAICASVWLILEEMNFGRYL